MTKQKNGLAIQMQAPNLNLAAPERVEPPRILNLLVPLRVEPEDKTEPVAASSDSGARISTCMNLPAPKLVVESPPKLNLASPVRVEPSPTLNLAVPLQVEQYTKGKVCYQAENVGLGLLNVSVPN